MSSVRSNVQQGIGFLRDPRRLNVALTRYSTFLISPLSDLLFISDLCFGLSCLALPSIGCLSSFLLCSFLLSSSLSCYFLVSSFPLCPALIFPLFLPEIKDFPVYIPTHAHTRVLHLLNSPFSHLPLLDSIFHVIPTFLTFFSLTFTTFPQYSVILLLSLTFTTLNILES